MSELEQLEIKITKYSEKVAQLMDAMSLINNRTNFIEQLNNLKDLSATDLNLVNKTKEEIKDFKEVQVPRFNKILEGYQRVQLVMLELLNKLDDEEEEEEAVSVEPNQIKENSVQNKGVFSTPMKLEPSTSQVGDLTTPRILLSAYKQSPFVRRRGPVELQFIDFEANIDQQDFNKIPHYIKGREHLSELQSFLENIIIKCFTQKYTLFHKNREIIRNPQDLSQWKLYHEQETYFPGQLFITQGDISAIIGKMLDKKIINRLGMLRHLHILQEQRKQSTVCYIWLKLIQT